ncbi:GxGYxYP domain-containing protein [Pleurocapsa sp. PCC 7319]|uniref:golvesin C-terminal-like domain-containing protein n=1 Tax=Pleurocapsa sp. PCC 7319 TaxID=118161 RepID=UPI00130DEA65|nr:GxGYxYP domain-containing protein [Pleurocapsa sp. PCC 7319]
MTFPSEVVVSLGDRNEMPLPEKIITVDIGIKQEEKDQADAILTSRVIQGLVNRQSADKIWLFNDNSQSGYTGSNDWDFQKVMLETLPEVKDLPRKDLQRQVGVNGGLHAILEYITIKYPNIIKGWVVWDPNLEGQVRLATSGAAVTIAAQKNYLAVSPELKELIESWGFSFTELLDLRELDFKHDWQVLNWLVDNYFATSNRQHQLLYSTGVNSWDNPGPYESDTLLSFGVIDYAVATNGFAFNIDVADANDDQALMKMLQQPGLIEGRAGIIGWVPSHPGRTETSETPKVLSHTSYYVIGTSISSNFSVLDAYPDSQVNLPDSKAYPVNEKDVFITWWIADGDNLDHTFKGMFGLFKQSPDFGQRGITWSVAPILAHLTPPLYNWYAQVLPPENDMGIIWADKWMCTRLSNSEQAGYVWRTFAKDTDLPVVNNFCDAEGHRADIVNWLGVIQGIYNVKQPVQRLDATNPDTAVIGMHMFQDSKYAKIENVREIADDIRQWAKTHPGPQFMPVSIGKATYWQNYDYFKIAKTLEENLLANPEGRKYHFLRARDLMMTYSTWQGRKWNWDREIEQDFVDNSESGFSMSDGWVTAPRSYKQYDKDYLVANADSNTWAQWQPNIKERGKYEVYLWWQPGKDRATNAKIIVNHLGGKEIKQLNQRKAIIRGWNLIGTYQLDGHSYLRIVNDKANGKVIADAARFLKVN